MLVEWAGAAGLILSMHLEFGRCVSALGWLFFSLLNAAQ